MRRMKLLTCVGLAAAMLCSACCSTLDLGNILDLLTGNLNLMGQAERVVWVTYPNAMLIEAQGAPSTGTATNAADIDRWAFVFDADSTNPGSGTVTIQYSNGSFGEPVYVAQGWVGTIFERLPRVLSLGDAVTNMRDGGFTDDFSAVTLRKALTFPVPTEASYAFSLPGQFVLVGAETGTITTE